MKKITTKTLKSIVREQIESAIGEQSMDLSKERNALMQLQARIEDITNKDLTSLSNKTEALALHLMDLGNEQAETAGASLFQLAELLAKPNAAVYRSQLANLINDIVADLETENGFVREQVGGMTPPSSSMEEAPVGAPRPPHRAMKYMVYGVDINQLIKDLDQAATSYFVNDIWGDFDKEAMNIGFDDLKQMALVRVRLANASQSQSSGSVDAALYVYRKCDTGCRDKFPPLMWKLSENQWKESQNKRLGVPAR